MFKLTCENKVEIKKIKKGNKQGKLCQVIFTYNMFYGPQALGSSWSCEEIQNQRFHPEPQQCVWALRFHKHYFNLFFKTGLSSPMEAKGYYMSIVMRKGNAGVNADADEVQDFPTGSFRSP